MISLTKAKIINWHYFWNQTVDFKQISFLTGKNGSGKSTLIDAIELVLLGDTTGRYFNKAAMEKSARTLKGYLRGEIGDDSSSEYRYLRNGKFTSYIALEFHDDVNTKDFVMGIVFDTESDGSEEHHFFSLDDKIPEKLLKFRMTHDQVFMDQDAFNAVIGNNVLYLPWWYNFLNCYLEYASPQQLSDLFTDDFNKSPVSIFNQSTILHLGGAAKPWMQDMGYLSKLYKRYYKRSNCKKYPLSFGKRHHSLWWHLRHWKF